MDVQENVEKVKVAAKKLNNEVTAKAKEMNTEMTKKAEELKNTTTKLANEVVESLKINERVASIKNVAMNPNKFALETTNNLIDSVEKNATQWQGVAEKAFKTGMKLVAKQEDLVLTSLEAVKNQMGSTATRVKDLFVAKTTKNVKAKA